MEKLKLGIFILLFSPVNFAMSEATDKSFSVRERENLNNTEFIPGDSFKS